LVRCLDVRIVIAALQLNGAYLLQRLDCHPLDDIFSGGERLGFGQRVFRSAFILQIPRYQEVDIGRDVGITFLVVREFLDRAVTLTLPTEAGDVDSALRLADARL